MTTKRQRNNNKRQHYDSTMTADVIPILY